MSHYYDPKTQKLAVGIEDAETALSMGLVPSVTTILSIINHPHVNVWRVKRALEEYIAAGCPQSKESISKAVTFEDTIASSFGTIGHALLEAYVKGIPVTKEILDAAVKIEQRAAEDYEKAVKQFEAGKLRYRPRMRNINFEACVKPAKDWIDANIKKVIFSERSFVDAKLGYAGTMDVLGEMHTGRLLLFDFKFKKHSSKFPMSAPAEYRYQLSAYRRASANILGIDYKDIWTGNVLCASQENDFYEGPFCDPWIYEGTDWFSSFQACKLIWEEQQQFSH